LLLLIKIIKIILYRYIIFNVVHTYIKPKPITPYSIGKKPYRKKTQWKPENVMGGCSEEKCARTRRRQ